MALWIIGYGMFLVSLFTASHALFGLSPTVWGFALIFSSCTMGSLVLWWRDELHWRESFQEQAPVPVTLLADSDAFVTESQILPDNLQQSQEWLPLEDEDFNLLETYTQDLTERVEAVYPLVNRDHVHKIVWTVMIELFCKRMAASSDSPQASIIAARMARAA